MKKLFYILIFVGFIAIAFFGIKSFQFISYISGPAGHSEAESYIEIKQGQSVDKIIKELNQNEIVDSPELFKLYLRIFKYANKIKPGYYKVSSDMSARKIADILISGKSEALKITIPEGYSMYQIAEIIDGTGLASKQEFLHLCKSKEFIDSLDLQNYGNPKTLEGFLFPETYFIPLNKKADYIIYEMVNRFKNIFTSELIRKAEEMKFTPIQILTLASIIEKETGAANERPMISSVFHNRLKINMRLQSDPTVLYGMGVYNFSSNITKHDLQTPTPYNTYTIPGIPPAPIANPGKNAIEAAVNPAQSKYLYFVSHNNGTHEFTENYKDHQEAVRKFQLDRKAREGKSWRDLNQN